MRTGRRCVWVLAVLAGCKSEASRLASELDKSISWLATTEAVAQAWSRNRVPTKYAERTMEMARQGLIDAGEGDAGQVIAAVELAVRRRDRDGVDEPLAALRDARQQLEDRKTSLKKAQ